MQELLRSKLSAAYKQDPELMCDKDNIGKTFGHNPKYLEEVLGINKSDLQKLEKLGLAVKAHYRVQASGELRVRWLIFKGAIT